MSRSDLIALSPLIIIAVTAVIIMLLTALRRNHLFTMLMTTTGLVLSIASLSNVYPLLPRHVTTLLILDSYAFFYMGLIFCATIATAIFSYGYLQKNKGICEEYYILLLLASLGSAILACCSHFISFFLGLEILSVSLYSLISYQRSNNRSVEAGIKYLVLAGVSSAFLIFGMALIYSEFGSMEFSKLMAASGNAGINKLVYLSGTALVLTGIGFKLAIVPFHLWTPDVYEGAPSPITGFIATVSKGAVFALLLRYFSNGILDNSSLFLIFTFIAAASMFTGNLLALLQNNVKRILAYSSISHLGYLLVAFLAGGSLAVTSVSFYLVAYFVTTLGAFGTIALLSDKDNEADTIEHFRSLAWGHPWLTGVFTVMIFSLAGIPLTAGFIGKFYLLYAGVRSALWFLVILLVINSAIGLFYYLRIIFVMFQRPENKEKGIPGLSFVSASGGAMLAVLTLILLWLGVYPVPVVEVIQKITIFH